MVKQSPWTSASSRKSWLLLYKLSLTCLKCLNDPVPQGTLCHDTRDVEYANNYTRFLIQGFKSSVFMLNWKVTNVKKQDGIQPIQDLKNDGYSKHICWAAADWVNPLMRIKCPQCFFRTEPNLTPVKGCFLSGSMLRGSLILPSISETETSCYINNLKAVLIFGIFIFVSF